MLRMCCLLVGVAFGVVLLSTASRAADDAADAESDAGAKTSGVGADVAKPSAFRPPPLKVPEGYTIELVAGPPLVGHPVMACFDERGRLFVAETAGKNLKRADLEKELPNFIRMLEDTDGDGKFDKSTIFADKLTFPQGVLPYNGAVYTCSSGALWKLVDTDGDNVADQRTKLVGDFGYTGNAADIHGPFMGPDGRLYWCEGRHGHEIKDKNGKLVSKGKAARIFSCKLDGSDVQTFCGGGMDNPVEIVFTEEGDMLGTCNLFYAKPRGDVLVHWVRGGVYPRYDFIDKLGGEFIHTGPPLTEVHNFGHVAVSGLCRYRSEHFGNAFTNNLFITQFNTNKVVRTILKPKGSTYGIERNEDFLTSTSKDFHPTDVLEDADGSLLIVDTGGWFRIGCPVSQVAKPNVKGAIYRVRKIGGKKYEDPWGKEIAWKKTPVEELYRLLADERHHVAEWAQREIHSRHEQQQNLRDWKDVRERFRLRRELVDGYKIVLAHRDESVRRRACWIGLHGGYLYSYPDHTKTLMNDDRISVRRTLMAALARVGPFVDAVNVKELGTLPLDHLVKALTDKDPAIRRQAAEAIAYSAWCLTEGWFDYGEFDEQDERLTTELLKSMEISKDDSHLQHALRLAITYVNDPKTVADVVKGKPQWVQDAGAFAVEQMRRIKVREFEAIEIPAPAQPDGLSNSLQEALKTKDKQTAGGNAKAGRKVFEGKKAACVTCHRSKGKGGLLGPNLSTVGKIRSRRDLLESILHPSASFGRGYEPYVLETDDRPIAGIIVGETSKQLHIATGKGVVQRVDKKAITSVRASKVSIMPAGMDKALSKQEMADLLAYLLSLK